MTESTRAGERRGSAPARALDELAQDARYAVRGLRRSPGFAGLAILVLALAIAANTSIFALIDVLMLRPLGLRDPERLVRVYGKSTLEADAFRSFSYPEYLELRRDADAFDDVAAFTVSLVGLDRGDGTTRREMAQVVTSNFFSTLGAAPMLGRSFTADEETPNSAIRSVIVSHDWWVRAGADPAAIGKPLEINGETYTIVGVAPHGFRGLSSLLSTDLWLPLGVYGTSVGQFMAGSSTDLSARDRHELMLLGVLRPGITEERALVELQTIASRLASEYPDTNRDYTIVLGPQSRFSISTQPSNEGGVLTTASIVMMAMAGIVLLVACLNLANMFLARGEARRTEIAIRQSLGGGRARILRQLLTEGFLVSLAGGAAGLLLGVWAARWVVSSIVPILPFGGVSFDVALDARVVLAALAYCSVATLLFALGPSFELLRSAVLDDLKDATARQTAGGVRRGRRLMPKNALVVAQIALSLALVTAAGLFLRSAQRANAYEPEFTASGRALIEMDTSLASLDEPRTIDLYRRVLERMRGQPGVVSAALASNVPFSSLAEGDDVGFPGATEDERIGAEYYVITSGYFETMGLALLRGRDFTASEAGEVAGETSAAVAIVDEPLARRLRADGDVIGRALVVSTPREKEKERTVEIVGVVPGMRRALFDRQPQPMIYLPFGGNYRSRMIVHLHANGGEEAATTVIATAGREIRAIEPRLPILSMKTLETHLQQGLERWMVRTAANVFAALGAVAVVLALVGVYGVKSYLVSRRTREIGIRMALGATPRDVLAWMLYEGMPSLAIGVGAGVLLALGVGRLLSSALYEVSGLDLVTFVAAPIALAAATLLAAYLPSRRATRLAPSQALREE